MESRGLPDGELTVALPGASGDNNFGDDWASSSNGEVDAGDKADEEDVTLLAAGAATAVDESGFGFEMTWWSPADRSVLESSSNKNSLLFSLNLLFLL